MVDQNTYHVPVLLKQSIEQLITNADGVYIDCTFGGGGHSNEILNNIGSKGKVLAFDQDLQAQENSALIEDSRFYFFHSNFLYLTKFLEYQNVKKIDGVLMDLGISSHQIDEKSRGFSFQENDFELDMRMNQAQNLSAQVILNSYGQRELENVFRKWGEIKSARKLSQSIVDARKDIKEWTTKNFNAVIRSSLEINTFRENKVFSKIYQALRLETNNEINVLDHFLKEISSYLNIGGRMVIISYHSLEDRVVKKFTQKTYSSTTLNSDVYGNPPKMYKLLYNGIQMPSEEEIELNPRSRSAKMRVIEKVYE